MSSEVLCGRPAITAALWVTGQRLVLCAGHYAHAVRVANVVGVVLAVAELEDGETSCTQIVEKKKAAGDG